MPKRTFSKEFKQDAVNLVLGGGVSAAQAARDLGLGLSTLERWVADHRKKQQSDEAPLSISEREELRQLRQENARLRMEHDILKKAAAYFAKNQL